MATSGDFLKAWACLTLSCFVGEEAGVVDEVNNPTDSNWVIATTALFFFITAICFCFDWPYLFFMPLPLQIPPFYQEDPTSTMWPQTTNSPLNAVGSLTSYTPASLLTGSYLWSPDADAEVRLVCVALFHQISNGYLWWQVDGTTLDELVDRERFLTLNR